MTMGATGGTGGLEGLQNLQSPMAGEIERGPEGDDVVRLGDEHVSGVESWCVGESQ